MRHRLDPGRYMAMSRLARQQTDLWLDRVLGDWRKARVTEGIWPSLHNRNVQAL